MTHASTVTWPTKTVDVVCRLAQGVLLEWGTEVRDGRIVRGPQYRSHMLGYGFNSDVNARLVELWLKKNRHLKCVRDGSVRIIEERAVFARDSAA